MSNYYNTSIIKKRRYNDNTYSMPVVNEKVIQQLNPRRREEILQYLELFGYNPDRTIPDTYYGILW